MSEIRDESLWESGKRKIEWVRQKCRISAYNKVI